MVEPGEFDPDLDVWVIGCCPISEADPKPFYVAREGYDHHALPPPGGLQAKEQGGRRWFPSLLECQQYLRREHPEACWRYV